mmetsp:Transcript_27291/g.44776  ORF Transcript_27291/g.44776 Transcript_27291/m.44776 type:complete len:135 (-) Transcript_27291:293-697(-)
MIVIFSPTSFRVSTVISTPAPAGRSMMAVPPPWTRTPTPAATIATPVLSPSRTILPIMIIFTGRMAVILLTSSPLVIVAVMTRVLPAAMTTVMCIDAPASRVLPYPSSIIVLPAMSIVAVVLILPPLLGMMPSV